MVNPLKGRGVNWLRCAIHVWPTFLISDIRILSPDRQSAQMSEIKNVDRLDLGGIEHF